MGVYIMQHGLYPRPLGLAKAISRHMSGKLSEGELEEVYARYTKRFFKQVSSIGCRRFSDGMFRWDDIFNPLISGIEGVEVNGLKRFYDNNYFFRQPVIKSRIGYREPIASKLLEKSLPAAREVGIDSSSVSLTLPGPLTMATNSLIVHSSYTIEGFMRDYAEKVLSLEIEGGLKIGVVNIDLHEPSLVVHGSQLEQAGRIYRELAETFPKARIWIITYFGYTREPLKVLSSIAGEKGNVMYSVDLAEAPPSAWEHLEDLIVMGNTALAIVNSRTTKMEEYRELTARLLRTARRASTRGDIYITHNASLEFLPEVVAIRKLKVLRRVAARSNKELG